MHDEEQCLVFDLVEAFDQIVFSSLPKVPSSLHMYAKCPELPYIVSTMDPALLASIQSGEW